MLAMEALAEHARVGDSYSLQTKLEEAQNLITSPSTIAMLIEHGLWNFNFLDGSETEELI